MGLRRILLIQCSRNGQSDSIIGTLFGNDTMSVRLLAQPSRGQQCLGNWRQVPRRGVAHRGWLSGHTADDSPRGAIRTLDSARRNRWARAGHRCVASAPSSHASEIPRSTNAPRSPRQCTAVAARGAWRVHGRQEGVAAWRVSSLAASRRCAAPLTRASGLRPIPPRAFSAAPSWL